jgi:hypothetical protein
MRLRVSIPQVDPTVMEAPEVCPYPDCDGKYFKIHRRNCDKPLSDTEYDQVDADGGRVCIVSAFIESTRKE